MNITNGVVINIVESGFLVFAFTGGVIITNDIVSNNYPTVTTVSNTEKGIC